eukprot:3940902-Rhodomonas_salina.2
MVLPGEDGVGAARGGARRAIFLRAPYAMSGTDIAYGAGSLCKCYAMSGTDIAYAPTRVTRGLNAYPGTTPPISLRAVRTDRAHSTIYPVPPHTTCGTEIAYHATRSYWKSEARRWGA